MVDIAATEIDADFCPTDNGIPMLGLGTWNNSDPEQCATSVQTALETGYRHIDTAQIYRNEAAVGAGIARADVDREDVFLATKLWKSDLAPEDVHTATRESLDRLDVEYVDMLYVHWPAETYEPAETLAAFAELHDEGLIRTIGVSNFGPDELAVALDVCDVPITANQVELHPLLQQESLRETCQAADVSVVAYSPLARGSVFEVDVLADIAAKYGVSEAKVSLAWLREQGVAAIPKATGGAHIRENWESLALELDREDHAAIAAIDRTHRHVDPSFAPWN